MRKQVYFLALAAAVLALGSCNNDDDFAPVASSEITVDASIGTMTRVATTGNASTFEAGDQISVYAWTGVADEVPADRVVDGSVNTYDGTTWSANPQMLWADMVSEHYFLAVYPSHEITDFKADSYTLDTSDQETSDLLIAVNNGGLTASNESVQLTFDHAMAKLVVNLHFRNQWDATPEVENVKLEGYTTAEVDYMAMTATGTTTGDVTLPALAEAPDNFELAYSSIVIPSTDTKTIRISIDNVDYVYNHDTYIPLERGKYTTINLNVGRDEITLAGVTVNDWVEGETIISGEAEEIVIYDLAMQTEDMAITSDCVIDGSSLTTAYTKQITITGDVEVTLKNVNQIASGDNKDAITINGDVTLNIEGENTINVSTNYTDAIRVNSGSLTINGTDADTLIIDGSQNRCGAIVLANGADLIINGGYIEAKSGSWQAGIGAGYASSDYPEDNTSCGDITINGGIVTATGGYYGAGIGAACTDGCGKIAINGGTITATGGAGGAGIGSGNDSSCGDIIITGGTITAKGGTGIGTAYWGTCGNITISGTSTSITAVGDGGVSIGADLGTCGTVTIGAGVTVNGTTYDEETVGEVENNS